MRLLNGRSPVVTRWAGGIVLLAMLLVTVACGQITTTQDIPNPRDNQAWVVDLEHDLSDLRQEKLNQSLQTLYEQTGIEMFVLTAAGIYSLPKIMGLKPRPFRAAFPEFANQLSQHIVLSSAIASMKTLKFKLYSHQRNRYLKRTINASGVIWNHCIALHKRYYLMWGKHLNCAKLQKHIAKLRKRNPFWQLVGSQAVQDICQRIEKAYQLFFKHRDKGVKPPGFKKVKKYKSFTLKQAGYKFLGGNRVKIGGKVYQYWNSREINGTVKTLTIKRTPLGELFMFVTVEQSTEQESVSATGKTAGFDFGLKTFLVCSEGFKIEAPLFFKQGLKAIQKASRELSRKRKGSANWERARLNLVRQHEKIANQRRDWFWKLAHKLTDMFDVLYFEDLNLKGMQRLWGRKVNDLAFGEFLQILQWVAKKKGKVVHFIDRWFPSSKTCHYCGHVLESLSLETRYWRCPSCSNLNDRDDNAAKNIKAVGASTAALEGDIRRVQPAVAV